MTIDVRTTVLTPRVWRQALSDLVGEGDGCLPGDLSPEPAQEGGLEASASVACPDERQTLARWPILPQLLHVVCRAGQLLRLCLEEPHPWQDPWPALPLRSGFLPEGRPLGATAAATRTASEALFFISMS